MDEEDTKVKQEVADAKAKEEETEPETVEPVYKYEPKTVSDWAVQNDNKPLWTRSPREVWLPTHPAYRMFHTLDSL